MNIKVRILTLLLFSHSILLNAQIITTVAGGGMGGGIDGLGDGLLASNAIFGNFCGIAFDHNGNLFIGDKDHNIVRKIDAVTDIITVVAGSGVIGYDGDGGLAINAKLNSPGWLVFDSQNNLYISDRANHRIRKVDVNGTITTYAGNGVASFAGDSGIANIASINSPQGICIDSDDNLYIADGGNRRIRKVASNGIITTLAGTGSAGYSGDNGPALMAEFAGIYGICSDIHGNVYVADWNNRRVRKINRATGIITCVSGNGTPFYSADNVSAVSTGLDPFDVHIDKSDNIFVADFSNNRIRKIDLSGIINTVAGDGTGGFGGDGGNADTAKLYRPAGVTIDSCSNLYIADNQNKRIRKVGFNPTCAPAKVKEPAAINNISIYPNPTSDKLTITSSNTLHDIAVINVIGQTVIKQNTSGDKTTLSISNLERGVYFVKVTDKYGGVVTKRFVKQ